MNNRKKLHKLIVSEKHKEAIDLLSEMDFPRVPVVLQILTHEAKHNLLESAEPIMTALLQDNEYEVSRDDLKDIDKEKIYRTSFVSDATLYLLEAMALDMCDSGQFQEKMNEIDRNARDLHERAETEKALGAGCV